MESIDIQKNLHRQWLKRAYIVAKNCSNDPNTQVGSCLVHNNSLVAFGANSFPKGVISTDQRKSKELKGYYLEHAERNSIFFASRVTNLFQNKWHELTLYAPYFSCADCGKAIIQSGIKKVIGHKQICDMAPDRWKVSIECALEMFREAGVEYSYYDGKIDDKNELFIIFDGKKYYP